MIHILLLRAVEKRAPLLARAARFQAFERVRVVLWEWPGRLSPSGDRQAVSWIFATSHNIDYAFIFEPCEVLRVYVTSDDRDLEYLLSHPALGIIEVSTVMAPAEMPSEVQAPAAAKAA